MNSIPRNVQNTLGNLRALDERFHERKTNKFINHKYDFFEFVLRSELAYGIRNGPYMVNCLIAGFDNGKPQLYWVDYMGTLVQSVRAAHG